MRTSETELLQRIVLLQRGGDERGAVGTEACVVQVEAQQRLVADEHQRQVRGAGRAQVVVCEWEG